jgi:hypothetical protein
MRIYSITKELVIMQGPGDLSLRILLYCYVIKAVLNPICFPTFFANLYEPLRF